MKIFGFSILLPEMIEEKGMITKLGSGEGCVKLQEMGETKAQLAWQSVPGSKMDGAMGDGRWAMSDDDGQWT